MFGLWYSLIGLVFGSICSYYARQKDRAQKDWFTLGFVFSFIAFGVILLLPPTKKEEDDVKPTNVFDDYRFSTNF